MHCVHLYDEIVHRVYKNHNSMQQYGLNKEVLGKSRSRMACGYQQTNRSSPLENGKRTSFLQDCALPCAQPCVPVLWPSLSSVTSPGDSSSCTWPLYTASWHHCAYRPLRSLKDKGAKEEVITEKMKKSISKKGTDMWSRNSSRTWFQGKEIILAPASSSKHFHMEEYDSRTFPFQTPLHPQ